MATFISDRARKTKHYQTNQQVKYLHLEAEVDMLLQKISALAQQKQLKDSTSKSLVGSD